MLELIRTHFGSLIVLHEATQGTLRSTERAVEHVDVDFSALIFALQPTADLQFSALCRRALA